MVIEGIDTTRVKAAVFDLGGVFLAGGVESVRAFGDRHGLTPDAWRAIRRDLFDDDEGIWSAVERGEATFADFVTRLRALAREQGRDLSEADARNFMGNGGPAPTQRLRPEIVAAAARIRTRMPTALLTNNIPEWRGTWRSLLDVERLFDVVVDSCDVGMRKPEPAIYELTRERLGLPHASIFFVDDLGVNLKAARALGWQTLRYDDTRRVLSVLDALAAGASRR
ncbi:MAG: HAD family phosphatase [Deltaproteobacteria bacterium]|nr:HAD family phosphatase [Deltaproteobacteria bacterium]